MKTLIDKNLEKNAPSQPIPAEVFSHADRTMMELRHAIRQAESLLEARYSGGQVVVHGVEICMSPRERASMFGLIWSNVLKRLTYWEYHAKRYVVISKTLAKNLETVRLRIDEAINGE